MQDVVIIGSGPAGLSAALYMLRGGFSTTVIGKDNGALEKAEKIENYFGLERPLSGHELIENGRTQVQRLGGTLLQDEVVGISWNGNYLISTVSTQIEARTTILTTGTSRKAVKIKNLAQLEGHGVATVPSVMLFSTAVNLSPFLEMASTPFMKSRNFSRSSAPSRC